MRAWPLHIVFATILVGSVAAKERGTAVFDFDDATLEAAVKRIAQSHDLAFLGETNLSGADVSALAFKAMDCIGPLFVVVRLNFDFEPFVRPAREQGDVTRYVYIDRSWEKPERLAHFIQRVKYAALAPLGLTPYVQSGRLLLVDSPPQCHVVDAIDWRNVWNRDYLIAIRDAEATPGLIQR
jgi:hypothetical protein